MDRASSDSSLLVGCSVTGPSHVSKQLPNQDAWQSERLDSGRYIIAVGDGLGTAEYADEGSKRATEVAVNELTNTIPNVNQLNSEAAEAPIKEAIIEAQQGVRERANSLDKPTGELETTLLVAVAGETGVAGAAVGDGGIVCNVDNSYSLLVPREEEQVELKTTRITVPIMQDNWEQSYRFETRGPCAGVSVFSDGLEEFLWDGYNANTAFFDSVFDLVRDHNDQETASNTLSKALRNDPYQNFGDDKTIVLVDFPPESSEESLQTEPVPDENNKSIKKTEQQRFPENIYSWISRMFKRVLSSKLPYQNQFVTQL